MDFHLLSKWILKLSLFHYPKGEKKGQRESGREGQGGTEGGRER